MYQLGWFSTGRDKAARELLTAVNTSIRRGEIKAEIAFVFCNREPGESKESDLFIKLVQDCRLPLICFSYQKFKMREGTLTITHDTGLSPRRLDYDQEVMKRLQDFRSDLCVLAGYMLIVGPEMCQRYKMINLHPAAPGGPTGTWQEVVWHLIDHKAQTTGVMMHLVTPDLDKGPPVTYGTFSLRGEPLARYWREIERAPTNSDAGRKLRSHLFELIRQHELAREFPLIIATLKAFSQSKIKITEDKKVVDSEGKPVKGYNLSSEVEEKLKEQIDK